MPIVDAQGLTRSYGNQRVLAQVDLTLRSGERVGLLGDNGAGKSTLARILAGLEMADAGEVHVRRGARVAYLAQAPDLDPALTAQEAVLSGLPGYWSAKQRYDRASAELQRGRLTPEQTERTVAEQASAMTELERSGGWDLSHRAQAVLHHLGVRDPQGVVGTMSGGEQRRVGLSRILVSAPELAILDEPTNHLDVETIEWLERYLVQSFAGAVLLITHDRYVLDRVAQRTLELSEGHVYAYEGGYAAYLEGKAERQAHLARVEANRQNFLRRELEWLRRGPKARGTKQKARIERAQAALSQQAPTAERELSLQFAEARSGKTVLELRAVSLRQGDRVLMKPLDFFVSKGERIGIIGPNGAGKTTLLRAILGEHSCASGHIVVGKNVDVAYLSQGRDGLDHEASVLENVAEGKQVIHYGGRDVDARGYLQRFFFDATRQRQPVGSLSGGERTRVALAKLLCREANLIILDEPTNDLDVSTLGALEEMLTDFGGTVLVVTHDRYFLDRVATAVLATEGDGTWTRYAGNYSDYLAQAPRSLAAGQNMEVTSKKPEPPAAAEKAAPRAKAKAKLTYGEEIELGQLPARIEAAEQAVSALERQLSDPSLYAERGEQVAGLQAGLAQAQSELEQLYARWELLEEKRGG